MALNSEIQTNQILTNDEVCIPRLSSILLAVWFFTLNVQPFHLREIPEAMNFIY